MWCFCAIARGVEGLVAEDPSLDRRCTFLPPSRVDQGDGGMVDLSRMLEEAVLQLKKDVPLELVVNMFQQLVRASSDIHGCEQLADEGCRIYDISSSRMKESSWAW